MIRYPSIITANEDKLKYLYRVVELLRLEHNEEGRKCREGEISESQFREYQKNSWEPRNQALFFEINKLKEKLDLVRNYNPEQSEKSLNLIKAQRIKEEGKKETKWDKKINVKKINQKISI